jgi:hypothetical protein
VMCMSCLDEVYEGSRSGCDMDLSSWLSPIWCVSQCLRYDCMWCDTGEAT